MVTPYATAARRQVLVHRPPAFLDAAQEPRVDLDRLVIADHAAVAVEVELVVPLEDDHRVNGSAASCPPRRRRRARRSGGLRRCRWWRAPGARAGCARRRAPGRPLDRPRSAPSSACRFASLSRPRSTCGRSDAEAPLPALPPVVHDDLVHDRGQRQLHGAHRPVRHHEGARPIQSVRTSGSRLDQPRGLDDDVRPPNRPPPACRPRERACRAPRVSAAPKASRDSGRRLVTRISSKSNSESSIVTLENAVPRAPMWPSTFASAPREVARTDRGHRAGAPLGDLGRVDDRAWHTGARVVQRQQRKLRGQPELVVVDVVAHHLHAARRRAGPRTPAAG